MERPSRAGSAGSALEQLIEDPSVDRGCTRACFSTETLRNDLGLHFPVPIVGSVAGSKS